VQAIALGVELQVPELHVRWHVPQLQVIELQGTRHGRGGTTRQGHDVVGAVRQGGGGGGAGMVGAAALGAGGASVQGKERSGEL
jgi:hypothetical protein